MPENSPAKQEPRLPTGPSSPTPEQAIDLLFGFTDADTLAHYMERVGYTPDFELRAILDIIRDTEVHPKTRLGAIHMLHQRRIQALEHAGQLGEGKIKWQQGPVSVEARRTLRAIANVQQALLEGEVHDAIGEHQPPDRGGESVPALRVPGMQEDVQGQTCVARPCEDGSREDGVGHPPGGLEGDGLPAEDVPFAGPGSDTPDTPEDPGDDDGNDTSEHDDGGDVGDGPGTPTTP